MVGIEYVFLLSILFWCNYFNKKAKKNYNVVELRAQASRVNLGNPELHFSPLQNVINSAKKCHELQWKLKKVKYVKVLFKL